MGNRAIGKWALWAMLPLTLTMAAGCAIFGVAAHALPPPTIQAAYKGLQNQTAAIMVWADPGIRMDFNNIQVDIARSLQKKMTYDEKTLDVDELKGLTWPVDPVRIVRYQHDYPQVNSAPVTTVAPKFGVSRLVYVEIQTLQARSDVSVDLFRGTLVGSLKVVEIKDGQAKVAYEENNIRAIFPPKSPEEGVPNADDYRIYLGVVDQFTTELAKRFIPHPAED
ncbi:MAG: hypothetical protein IT447_15675 [Phycisphaerales bacterium]|nr:hypothetical protein [Phycisphaerales bacterium]